MTTYDFERNFFAYLENLKNQLQARPLVLGGVTSSGGGGGGPPGGFIGKLPQTQVTFDTTEAELNEGSTSLLDNLNKIRYRVKQLELASGVSGGHTIQNSGVSFTQRTNLNFTGNIIITDDEGNDATVVNIPVGSGNGDVLGSPSAIDNHLAVFDGDGYHLKDGGEIPVIHDSVTVLDTSTIDLNLSGQQISGSVIPSGIKLDDLGEPDINTDLDVSVTKHGLAPKGTTGTTQFWRQDWTLATPATGSGIGGHTIQYSGISQTNRTNLNFIGNGVTVLDDEVTDSTIINVSGGVSSSGTGHTIQYSGIAQTNRVNLNFVGNGVVITDDEINNSTEVTISSSTSNADTLDGHHWNEISDTLSSYWYVDGLIASGIAYGHSFIVPNNGYLNRVWIYGENTGTAGTTIVDINNNGTTVYTNQDSRPSLVFNSTDHINNSIPNLTTLANGDILTLDIDQIATGARNFTVVLDISRTPTGTQSVRPGMIYWTFENEIETGSSPFKLYNRSGYNRIITGAYLNLEVAPIGTAIIVDIHQGDGINPDTTIFTNQSHRPQIAVSDTDGQSTDIDVYNWPNGSYLVPVIDQIGSIEPGQNLVVTIVSE